MGGEQECHSRHVVATHVQRNQRPTARAPLPTLGAAKLQHSLRLRVSGTLFHPVLEVVAISTGASSTTHTSQELHHHIHSPPSNAFHPGTNAKWIRSRDESPTFRVTAVHPLAGPQFLNPDHYLNGQSRLQILQNFCRGNGNTTAKGEEGFVEEHGARPADQACVAEVVGAGRAVHVLVEEVMFRGFFLAGVAVAEREVAGDVVGD